MPFFEIMGKDKSKSPTILIKATMPNGKILAIKLWTNIYTDNDHRKHNESLEYEKKIYEKKIKPLLEQDPTLSFLPYVGEGCNSSADDVANFLRVDKDSDEEMILWYGALFYFINNPYNNFDYTDYEISEYMEENEKTILDIRKTLNNVKIQCILLPYIDESMTFGDYFNINLDIFLILLHK